MVSGHDWIISGECDCMRCHTVAAGFVMGSETAQLNGDFACLETGITAKQLFKLESIGYFSWPTPDKLANLPPLGSSLVHSVGEVLIAQWIDQLAGCQ